MSQFDKESLSALMDNEADDLELRRLLKSCEQDPSLLETWERYNLVQSLLHGPACLVSAELSKNIAAQIESEATPVAQQTPFILSNWQLSLARFAVAASVAVVFIFVVQISLNNDSDTTLAPAIADQMLDQDGALSTDDQAAQTATLVAESNPLEVDPVARERLREYIESMTFEEKEPAPPELLQDSPLFRLVNELEDKP